MRSEKEIRAELHRLKNDTDGRKFAADRIDAAIDFLSWVLREPPFDFEDATKAQRLAHIAAAQVRSSA